ncbi:Glucoamylase (glucan-1,4-alpha-glucosidase), GH15 family [Methylobacterium phyllostachyos]|uniref:Glucoamylase (Glucan-1,4-alpha-glucosidase), GH15 family n=1 Tax=Methylobacterium phyllostachyos TaxID=582672 RepID=A0A1G9S2R4_9HYPH|nr:glycoside hydrolase family 15 protein [Methylobacterium phyllostachyos]SDM29712.1 Glucoamylase (glucan-1,4-alpha-glucosidase), GH15 family [Methylobacterium phyllostachyos]
MSKPIESYALIGDGQTAALVARDGSIDWLCWPEFDSDACLSALLGDDSNGRWLVAPRGAGEVERRYCGDTLVLETVFHTDAGRARVTDFMPIRGRHSSLVRIVEGLSGTVAMDLDLRLRFDYGALAPWCEARGDGAVATVGQHRVYLRAPMPVTVSVEDGRIAAGFTLREGESHALVLTCTAAWDPEPEPIDPRGALTATLAHWEGWIGTFDASRTRWPEAVKRSLLTLKAMVHQRSGGLIAAPTTSLPEAPAGAMNWDYRYSWLRDATFTLGAFINAGFCAEATAWRDWLLRAIAGDPDAMRIMYRVDGSRHLDEWTVDELPGYREARPVRIGNAASTQVQIDVYGEVLDTLALARRAGIEPSAHQTAMEARIVAHLERVWHHRGSGVWESRGQPRQYTYSKAMCWVGFDRALAHANLDGPTRGRLESLRARVHAEVCHEGWNAGLSTFTQSYGSHALDASLLLLPLVGFLPVNDPRMAATIARIGTDLDQGGFIRRTRAKGDGTDEGVFLPCSLWMADCLRLQDRHDEAAVYLERVLGVANDVGLLSEEYDVPGRCLTGNFPQALTHLAVVNTALGLSGPVLNRGGG